MGKTHVHHRVVIRDANDQILGELQHDSFSEAKPIYDEVTARLKEGQIVTLQHGARVIFKSGNVSQNAVSFW